MYIYDIMGIGAFVETYYIIFKLFLLNNTIWYISYELKLILRERERDNVGGLLCMYRL